MLANVSFAVPVITFTANGVTTFCSGNSSTKLRVTTTENIWVQLQYADIGSSTWTNVGFPTEILAGTPYDLTAYYVSSKQYQITYDFDFTMPAPTLFLSTITLTVNPLPTITTTGTLSALCYSTNIQSATLSYSATTYTPTSYTVDWNASANTAGLSDQTLTLASFSGGAGNLATINIASSVISGTYNGSLIISNSNGCSSSKSISIVIKPLPVVSFDIDAGLNVCQNTEITYTTQSGKTNYQWTPAGSLNTEYVITNGGLGLTNNTVSLKWLTTGPKTMQINYTDVNSCTAVATTNTTTTVNALPSVTITKAETSGTANNDAIICIGTTITLSGGGASTYSWTGGISDGVAFSPTTTTTYTLTGTDINSCSNTLSQTVTVNALPSVTITKAETSGTANNDATICKGATITLSGGGASTYSWTGGISDGVAFSPTMTTTYKLTGTDINSCSNTLSQTVTVNALPSVTITKAETSGTANNDATICKGATITLSGGGASTYSWTGGISDGVVFSPTTTTTYTLRGTDINSCSNTLSQTVSVNVLPSTPTITSPTICEGQTTNVSMSLPAGTYTYTWQVPTGVATSTTKTVSTTKAGTYSLTITDENSCTSEEGTGIVTVNALPAKPTLTSQEICEGATATITGQTGVYTYTWQVPTGVATSTTSTVSTSKAGTYSLTITDANSCTSEVGTATVTVNALPTKPTLTSSTICEGQSTSVTMSLPAGTYTYTWQVPSGVATSTTNTVSTSKAGTYSLTITDVNSCSSEVGTATVVVHVLPAKPTLTSPTICEGETASITMLTPTGTNTYTYTWTVPTGVASSTTNTVSTSKAGTYSLTITDANSCSSEVGTGTVTVNPLPTLTITNPAAVCAPGTIDLTASTITAGSTASLTYTYFTNAIATSTLTNTSLIGTSGTYYIKGTSSSNCSAIKSVNTIINTIPSFNVLSPSVCVGAPLTISANPFIGRSSDYDYTWEVPTGVANPGNVSSFTTTTAGVYTATIKNKSTTCESATLNNIVTFYPLPIAATIVATNNKVIANSTLNLTAAATGGTSPYRFTWVPNPSIYYSISGQENAVFTALKEGKVKFKYQVKDANNCEVNSAEYEITIDPADIVLVLPNAFTPNGDGNNDEFKIAATNTLGEKSFVYFEIYNRNGKLLTNKITDIKAGWNGRSLEGIMQDMGVYFVKLVKLNNDGQQVVETSPIYLLK